VENHHISKYEKLPRPKSFMPGPVAPWSSIAPPNRKILFDDFLLSLKKQELAQEKLNEFNDTKIEPSSAVLAPFILDDAKQYLEKLVVTQRSKTMKSYSGHISFPGGRIDEQDNSLEECALRETNEEIGIDSTNFEIVGMSNSTFTKSKEELIAPYVGLIKNDAIGKAKININEVESLHVIKVSELLKADNYYCEVWDAIDASYLIHIFTVTDMLDRPVFIWGATAQIIFDLLSISFK
jgi:nudix motif 8